VICVAFHNRVIIDLARFTSKAAEKAETMSARTIP